VRPGVYRMLDAKGDVLYVGKARALKNRVTNYTQVTRLSKRLQRMVAQTRDMLIVTTNTEAEALLLEAQLIKRYRPPYNVLLATTKASPSSCFGKNILSRARSCIAARGGQGAILRAVRQRRLGPDHAHRAPEAVPSAQLHRQLLRQSRAAVPALPDQTLLGAMRRAHRRAGYAELSRTPRTFLAGRSTRVQERLGKAMAEAAENMDFELAAVYRDRLRALTYVQGTQTVHAEGLGDADIFALACKAGRCASRPSSSAAGRIGGIAASSGPHQRRARGRGADRLPEPFYEEVPPPKTILLDRELAEGALLAEAFSARAERKVSLRLPQRGDHAKMIRQPSATRRRRSTGGLPKPARSTRICAACRAVRSCPSSAAHRSL
jgi:excinuclease ABC subunit C